MSVNYARRLTLGPDDSAESRDRDLDLQSDGLADTSVNESLCLVQALLVLATEVESLATRLVA